MMQVIGPTTYFTRAQYIEANGHRATTGIEYDTLIAMGLIPTGEPCECCGRIHAPAGWQAQRVSGPVVTNEVS